MIMIRELEEMAIELSEQDNAESIQNAQIDSLKKNSIRKKLAQSWGL